MQFNKDTLNEIVASIDLPKVIETDEEYKMASDSAAFLIGYKKKLDMVRKNRTKSLLNEKRTIDGKFKKLSLPLENMIALVKARMLPYAQGKRQEQKQLESKAMIEQKDQREIIVDDVEQDLKRGEESSNTLSTKIAYRLKDEKLRKAVVIKPKLLKEYLKNHYLPDWIETYQKESVVIRNKRV